MVNDALFVAVLTKIEREPHSWYQGAWRRETPCGTTHCFAGHAVAIASPQSFVGVTNNDGVRTTDEQETWFWYTTDGEDIGDVAARLLGLNRYETTTLFHETNSLDALYKISAQYMGIDEQVLRDKIAAEVSA